jgi:hypothetical protein
MPRRYAMSDLVTRCQRRADKENDDHIASAEWKSIISEAYGELCTEVSGTGLRYFETSYSFPADGSTSYDEPAAHLSTVAVTRVDSSGREWPLDELMHQEEAYLRSQTGDARYWTLVDDQLFLYPKPSSGTYCWYYIPQPTDLASYADADIVDVVSPHGEAFLIWSVVVKAKAKSEEDVRLAVQEREAARARLIEWATLRALESRRPFVRDAVDAIGSDDADWWFR